MIQRHLLFIQCPSYRVSQNVLQQQQDRDAGNCQVGQTCSATGGTEATRWPEEAGRVSVSPFLSGSTVLNLTQRPLSEPRGSGHGCTLARARTHRVSSPWDAAKDCVPTTLLGCRSCENAAQPCGNLVLSSCCFFLEADQIIFTAVGNHATLVEKEALGPLLRSRPALPAPRCGSARRPRRRWFPRLRAPPPTIFHSRENKLLVITLCARTTEETRIPTLRAVRVQNKGLR